MQPASPSSVLAQTLTRLAMGSVAILGSVGASLLAAVFGGGPGALFAGGVAAFYLIGWIFLPAIRAWKLAAIVAVVAWIGLAFPLARFGEADVKGWLMGPWTFASALIAASLVIRPPGYVVEWLKKGREAGEA